VTVLRVLRGLEARGLVTRTVSPDSKRNMSVELTAEGTNMLGKAQKAADKASKRVLAPLDREQQAQFLALLQQLTGALEEDARAALVPPQNAAERLP
jgi:DNA-binding MarR family transcriptional regulator